MKCKPRIKSSNDFDKLLIEFWIPSGQWFLILTEQRERVFFFLREKAPVYVSATHEASASAASQNDKK